MTTKSDTAGHCDKIRCLWRQTGDTRILLATYWGQNQILLARKTDTSMSARTNPRGWPLAFATTAAHIPVGIPEHGTRYDRGLRSGGRSSLRLALGSESSRRRGAVYLPTRPPPWSACLCARPDWVLRFVTCTLSLGRMGTPSPASVPRAALRWIQGTRAR